MNLSQRLTQLPSVLGAGVVALLVPGMRQTMEIAAHHEQYLHWARCLGMTREHALKVLDDAQIYVAERGLRTAHYRGRLVPYELARQRLLRELNACYPEMPIEVEP